MKKITLLILTLVFATGIVFAQTFPGAVAGDFRTKSADPYYFWSSSSTWEKFDGTSWNSTTDIPGITAGAIVNNVYIQRNIYLRTTISVNQSGKIWVRDNSIVTLNIGLGTGITGGINNYGDIDIQSGANAKLKIWDNSHIWVYPGGTITDNSGGNVTSTAATSIVLYSTSGTENASLITGSSVTGTISQTISPSQWHFIAPPLSGVTANDFWDGANDVFIKPYLSPGGGWGGYISDISTPINSGIGYEVWETSNFLFSKSGTFNTGNQTLYISTGGTGVDTDWNLVGNPYPCGLDWNLIADKTNAVGSTFYVWNGSSYLNHNGTSGTAPTGIIPPFQGFFVMSAGTGDLNFSNEQKAHPGINNELYKSSEVESYTNHMKINAEFNGHKSVTIAYQQNNATNGRDILYDAPMLYSNNDILDIYTFAGDQKSSINIYGEYPYVMQVAFKVPEGGGEITLSTSDLRNLDANLTVYLEDKVTGEYIDFLENPSYTFTALGGDLTDRIYLIYNNNVGFNNLDKNKNISIFSARNAVYLNYSDYQFTGKIKIYNLLGQNVFESAISNNSYHPIYLNEPSGYYFVELLTKDEVLTQKVFIQQR